MLAVIMIMITNFFKYFASKITTHIKLSTTKRYSPPAISSFFTAIYNNINSYMQLCRLKEIILTKHRKYLNKK